MESVESRSNFHRKTPILRTRLWRTIVKADTIFLAPSEMFKPNIPLYRDTAYFFVEK